MQRVNCERYPCHFSGQDCSLCFCPFYPCMDERTCGRAESDGWHCDDCTIVHVKEVSDMVMDALMRGEAVSSAWKEVEKLL